VKLPPTNDQAEIERRREAKKQGNAMNVILLLFLLIREISLFASVVVAVAAVIIS